MIETPDVRQVVVPHVLWEAVTGLLRHMGLSVARMPAVEDDLPTYILVPTELANARITGTKPCDHTAHSTRFDRTVCAEPCGVMHTRCAGCGAATDECRHTRPATTTTETK